LLLKKLLNIPPDFAKSNVIEMLENENDCLAFLLTRVGEPICYHGPQELCIVAGGPKNQFCPKIISLSNY